MLRLDIAYWCTKFDHSSLSRSGGMVGVHQNLNGSRHLTTPLSGMICHPQATINLPTKFEVSISAHYKDIKRDIKFEKWNGLGVVRVTQGH